MPTRLRKLLGGVAILIYLVIYAAAAATLADYVPDRPLLKLGFFALAGVLWGAPLLPLLSWMNRGP